VSAYPAHLETDVVLRDGCTVHVRPARPDDRDRLEDYFIALSDESRRLRFWGQVVNVSEQAEHAVEIDYGDHLTLLAFSGTDPAEVVGGAQYIREGAARAEIAMSVSDELQGHGLASILIAHLAEAARAHGIEFFSAQVLPENHRMIDVFRGTGFPVTIRARPGVVEVEFPTTATEETSEQYAERERIAAANAVRRVLEPRSIAVVGASRDPTTIGGRLLRNLVTRPFTGVVYPVNPAAEAVQGIAAYPSVSDVPGDVDLAFVVVPAPHVIDVVRDCGAKGAQAVVVISAGFAETGDDGARLQDELVEVCRASGMRLVGPNCMGVINTDPDVALDGTFAQAHPPEGRVAFMSQSGALGIAVINMATQLGLGLSTFVSIGNKADVSPNDLLCYWGEDERTEVVLLYIESFGNPRRFADLVRRIGREKPVVVVKSGRSAAGRRAASSHTGALLASSDSTVDALLRQVGVTRTDTLEEMFDVAALLANQPVPRGRNVAIVTNAGGLGIQCADTCEARGLHVPELGEKTVAELRSFLPPTAGVGNPVDMIASATADDYGRAIRTVAADPAVDALIVIYIPPLEDQAPAVARNIVDAIGSLDGRIPALTCFMSSRGLPEALSAPGVRVPSYAFPEQAAIALAHAADHGDWLRQPVGSVPAPEGVRADEAAAVVATALERGDGWLEPQEVSRLLGCYGVPLARTERAGTPEAAAEAAVRFEGPIVLKAVGPVHKTETGAVRVGLTASEARHEAQEMAERVTAAGERLDGFLVQELVTDGVEMLVGMTADPEFGPIVVCGSGGVTVELTRDVAVRVAPLTDLEAAAMVRSLATFPLLDGFRGAASKDVKALEDVVLRISAMASDLPAIAEMDCNPVMVLDHGAVVVDARVRVRAPAPHTPATGRAGA
jgi:acetyl coenzyme A synthetase (ADP forming)-like protein